MYRVLITDNLAPAGLKVLEAAEDIEVDIRSGLSPEEVREALKEADGIIIRSGTTLTSELLEGQDRLKAIVRAGVGVDNIDRDAASRAGVVVMNTPGGNTVSTAEHTIAMMMSLCRNIGPAFKSMAEGRWDRKKYTGTQVAGKTVAVVGLGRIGLEVASRCQGLEMNVVGYDPFLSEERAKEQGIELYRDLDELLDKCDILTVHTPMTEETRGLINAERIAKMKPGVRIINCARGGIVDEKALADAVKSGHVGGAALDVYTSEPPAEDNPVLGHENILCVPHLGASTDEAQELVALEAAEIMVGFLSRGEIRHAVNMAPVSASEMAQVRPYLNLSYRLGLVLSQMHGRAGSGGAIKSVRMNYRGDVADKPTKLITQAFTCGLLSGSLADEVHIINAGMVAKDRGIEITETKSNETGAFSTLISATLETESGSLSVAGTMFGNEFLRLVRVDDFQLDAYLDGLLLIYKHRDVPGLIGAIGSTLGSHDINISHMALGRRKNEPGGDAIAVLNLDNEPSDKAIGEIAAHPEVTGVQLVRIPKADEPLPWLGG